MAEDVCSEIIRAAGRHLDAASAGDLARRALEHAEQLEGGIGDGWRRSRKLTFDEHRSIGALLEMRGPAAAVTYHEIGHAMGAVSIAAGTRVMLDMTDSSLAAWQQVAQLKTGDLQGLVARGAGSGAHHLPATRNIAHLTDLQELCLTDCHVDLSHLRRLTQLVDLRLERCTIEHGGTAADLAQLERLEELRIIDCALDWRGFTPRPGLRVFAAVRTQLADDAAARLERCTAITDLELASTNISDFRFLHALRQVRGLVLRDSSVDDADFAQLPLKVRLEELDLRGTSIGDITMQRIATQYELRELMIDDTHVTDSGIRAIRHLNTLRLLWCSCDGVTGASLRSIGALTNLTNLGIGSLRATDDDARHLATLTQLRHLWADNNAFTDDLADACQTILANLRSVCLSYSDIGQRVIDQLDGARVRLLRIRGCDDVTTIESILTHGQLEHLDAGGCRALSGFRGISTCSELRTLDLRSTAIGATALRQLRRLTALRELDLGGTGANDAVLAETLHRMPLLESLNLAATAITDATLHQLVEHPSLRELLVQHTRITSAGIAAIATCRHLDTLVANSTLIDDAAISHLATLTRPAPSPHQASRLDDAARQIAGTSIEPRGTNVALHVAANIDARLEQLGIARPVAINASHLRRLDVSRTDVTGDALLALRRHPRLTSVRIDRRQHEQLPARHRDGIEGSAVAWRIAR